MQRSEVHPDYHWQSDADIQAVRLFVRARKPEWVVTTFGWASERVAGRVAVDRRGVRSRP
jgi:hypothetical protein